MNLSIRLDSRWLECLPVNFKAGTLALAAGGGLFLTVGKMDLGENKCRWVKQPIEKKLPSFVSPQFIEFLKWMSYKWISPLSLVVNLFFHWLDVKDFGDLQKVPKNTESKIEFWVFPDLRVMSNWQGAPKPDVVLHGGMTKKAFKKAFEMIKLGEPDVVFATPSGVFVDHSWTSKLKIVLPHTRYYKNQRQPKYRLPDVAQKIGALWGVDIEMVEDWRIW